MLSAWWNDSWTEADLEPPGDGELDGVLARYSEPHRAYHSLQHLEECREWFHRTASLCAEAGAVQLALWYHDAIYDPKRNDNEVRSAELAAQAVQDAGGTQNTATRVASLVMATCHDAQPMESDAQLLVDIDLAILGAGAARFREYEAQVRREYSWVPAAAFAEGRADILRRFLARDRIYSTDYFHRQLERPARTNLQRAVEFWDGQR